MINYISEACEYLTKETFQFNKLVESYLYLEDQSVMLPAVINTVDISAPKDSNPSKIKEFIEKFKKALRTIIEKLKLAISKFKTKFLKFIEEVAIGGFNLLGSYYLIGASIKNGITHLMKSIPKDAPSELEIDYNKYTFNINYINSDGDRVERPIVVNFIENFTPKDTEDVLGTSINMEFAVRGWSFEKINNEIDKLASDYIDTSILNKDINKVSNTIMDINNSIKKENEISSIYTAISRGLSNVKTKEDSFRISSKRFIFTMLEKISVINSNNKQLGLIGNKKGESFFRTAFIKARISSMEKSVNGFNRSLDKLSENDLDMKQIYYNIIEAYNADIRYLSSFAGYLIASFLFRVRVSKDIMSVYKQGLRKLKVASTIGNFNTAEA